MISHCTEMLEQEYNEFVYAINKVTKYLIC